MDQQVWGTEPFPAQLPAFSFSKLELPSLPGGGGGGGGVARGGAGRLGAGQCIPFFKEPEQTLRSGPREEGDFAELPLPCGVRLPPSLPSPPPRLMIFPLQNPDQEVHDRSQLQTLGWEAWAPCQ